MKALLLVIGLLASVPAVARDINAATFTPNELHGVTWKSLGEGDSSHYWYGHVQEGAVTFVILKEATYGIGDGYSSVRVFTGMTDCRQAKNGVYPSVLSQVSAVEYTPPNWIPDQGSVGDITLERGTVIGTAVRKSCDEAAHG